MEPRLKGAASPGLYAGIAQFNKVIHAGGVDKCALSLVHLRASQINGCSPCVFASIVSAKKAGESDERVLDGYAVAFDRSPRREKYGAISLRGSGPDTTTGSPTRDRRVHHGRRHGPE